MTVKELIPRLRGEAERDNFKKVIEIYEEFVAADPDRYLPLTVRVLYAEALASTGQVDEAIVVLQGLVSEVPVELDYLRLQYDLATLLSQQGKKQEAQKAYEKLLLRASEQAALAARARERVAKMKGREARRGDEISIQLLDIETALDAGQVPSGSKEFMKGVVQRMPESPHAERARQLLEKVRMLEDEKAVSLLNEARRLFDKERKYGEVREILQSILKDYPDFGDIESVEVLMREVDRRLGRVR